jgi:hypothetical protein
MLSSPKTIVGHEVGAIMMNSCNIFKICKWGKMRFIQRKTHMAFLVLGLKVTTIILIQYVSLFHTTTKLHCSCTSFDYHVCPRHIYDHILSYGSTWDFFEFYVFWQCNM